MRDGRFYTFWVYMMGSRTGTLYAGMTGFFTKRVGQHKSGLIEGFTERYGVNRLLYYEVYGDIGKAKRRELQIKGWSREKKIKLIEKMNPRWEDLAEHLGQAMRFQATEPEKNSLNQYGTERILWMLRLRPRSLRSLGLAQHWPALGF